MKKIKMQEAISGNCRNKQIEKIAKEKRIRNFKQEIKNTLKTTAVIFAIIIVLEYTIKTLLSLMV